MKLPLLLCLLLAGCDREGDGVSGGGVEKSRRASAGRSAPADEAAMRRREQIAAAARDPNLQRSLARFGKEDFGEKADDGAIGYYFGRHYPEAGVAWLAAPDEASKLAECHEFGSAIAIHHPERVCELYEKLGHEDMKTLYLFGILEGPREHSGPILESLWKLTGVGTPYERGIAESLLVGHEAKTDPLAAWEHLQRRGESVPNKLLENIRSLDEKVPYPAALLDRVAEARDVTRMASQGIRACRSPENLAPLERWLAGRPDSDAHTRWLLGKMASQQTRLGRHEEARAWAERLTVPDERAAALGEIEANELGNGPLFPLSDPFPF